MCGSARNQTTMTAMITPEQKAAESMLMAKATEGQKVYDPNAAANQKFDVTPEGFAQLVYDLANPEKADTLGLWDFLRSTMATGNPVDQTAAVQAERAVASTAATRAGEAVMGRAGASTGRYSTPMAGAAAAGAAEVQAKAEAAILQQVVATQEAAQQRRMQAAELANRVVQANQSLRLDAARLGTAIQQFNQGMNYEEWKRVNPDVYQLLTAVWGRQVDQLVANQKGWLGPALQVVGGIISVFAPVAGMAVSGAGSYFASEQGKITNAG